MHILFHTFHIALLSLLIVLFPLSTQAVEDGPLAVAAAQYRHLIRETRLPDDRPAAKWVLEAENQAQQEDWPAAIAAYETAIASGADCSAVWLKLSQSWEAYADHQQKQQKVDPPAVYRRSRERIRAAAWNAVHVAHTPAERAQALFRLGELYDQDKAPKQALAAWREALDLQTHPRIAQRYQELANAEAFQIKGVEVQADAAVPKICLNFSEDLAKGRQVPYEDYLAIEPPFQIVVTAAERQLCIEGGQHGRSYVITARAGIPAANGETTRTPQEFTVHIDDRKPTLGFRGATYVLPKIGNPRIPLTSVNVERAELRLLRINERNLLREIDNRRITQLLNGPDLQAIAQHSGEEVWTGTWTLETGERNQEVTTALPVTEWLPHPQPGIYILVARPIHHPVPRWEHQATQWLVVSDLGLFTMRGKDGLHVFVRSLATAQPVAGVDLRLYARNNTELGQSTSDARGYARFDPGLLRGQGGREPVALMAFGSSDYNFLDLARPAFDLSDRGVEGRPAPGAIDAFLYTERGIYRPGETVELMTLIRDSRGFATVDEIPLTLKVFRPDEIEVIQLHPTHPALSGYHSQIPLPPNARTGKWTVRAYTDPYGKPVGEVGFQVEDFVPQRLKLELYSAASSLKPGDPTAITLQGRFLYGAPAAHLPAEGEIILREDRNPYPAFPGYRFGLVQETWTTQRFPIALANTDAEGRVQAPIALSQRPDTSRLLQAQIRVSLFEPGGRPVTRSLDLPYRIHPFVIGIKPRFSDDGIQSGQEAAFEVIVLDPQGRPQAQSGLTATLVREEYEYYRYHHEGRWNYQRVRHDSTALADQTVTVTPEQPAVVAYRGLDWGCYRLEVRDMQAGVASSVRFTVGWFQTSGKDEETPDQMKVTLDQPRYVVGATAKIFLRPPFAGEVLLNVVSDRLWLSQTIHVPASGTTVELPVSAEWGAGVYVAATAFRPADPADSRGPGRAIGVAWLALDPAPRTLHIALEAPAEWSPRRTVELPITVSGSTPGQPSYVTVAAVDEGILQLTDFATPDPVQHFLGKRLLEMQLRDLYGKLIEAGGRSAAPKVGGDAESRQSAPSEIRTVKTLALFSGPVALDAKGQARISLTLPDFNGRLRIMAIAWDGHRFGKAEAALLVRDPLIAEVYLPRFLAPDDESRVTVTVQNLHAPAGEYTVYLTAEGAVRMDEPTFFTFPVTAAEQQNQDRRLFTVRGIQPGAGKVRLHLTGPGDLTLVREADIRVRPVQTVQTEHSVQRLEPGGILRLDPHLLADFVPTTGRVRLSMASRPTLGVPELLAQLERYPYGCVEQITSRALPLLYFNQVATAWIGETPQNPSETGLRTRVQEALQRLLTFQNVEGGFSLWRIGSSAETWLSAYAMDFISRARQEQYFVPESAWQRGLSYLRNQLSNDNFADTALGGRAYALYVLAREQQAAIGDLRYLYDHYLHRLPTGLAQAQLGASLARYGELERAKQAFTAALNRQESEIVRDYGTGLRDRAALLTLLAETGLLPERLPQLADEVADQFHQRRFSSTQEQAWLLLAARALLKQAGAMRLAVEGQTITTDPFYLTLTSEQLLHKPTVVNQGTQAVWTSVDVSGVLITPQPPAQEGFTITRRYYTRGGQEVDPNQIRQNDLLVVVITGYTQSAQSAEENQLALVVDLLPAGLEIENARLTHHASTAESTWLPELTETLHTEVRDDRFVAALSLDNETKEFTLAYLARAVTPGIYRHPAVYVEDMYKPWHFGRGALGTVRVE